MAKKRDRTRTVDATDQESSVTTDKQEIRSDRYLRLMMKTGIPLALISILSLWLGRLLDSDGLGLLFFITCPLALAIGFGYNIRYVSLAVRRQRQQQNKD